MKDSYEKMKAKILRFIEEEEAKEEKNLSRIAYLKMLLGRVEESLERVS